MTNTWIIEVLTDLQTFAKRNGLPVLATELAGVTRIALAEIGTQPGVRASYDGQVGAVVGAARGKLDA